MHLDRDAINALADYADLEELAIQFESIDDVSCALLGYQRTKQISRQSRSAWEDGNRDVLLAEVKQNKDSIIRGSFLEIYQEYLPVMAELGSREISSVCDIGCGQGINNVFLHLDYAPSFTLVDIEHTDEQYHMWSGEGSGYASLEAAKALLLENGADPDDVTTINPTQVAWNAQDKHFNLVTSLYSCGFHYPIDDYLQLFLNTVENDGVVCLDLRRRYLKRNSDALDALKEAAQVIEVYEDARSFRWLFRKA